MKDADKCNRSGKQVQAKKGGASRTRMDGANETAMVAGENRGIRSGNGF